ncbi:hypothetical protein [Cellulomonas aerilata]|nr:hypothetical protein [Cellulomonas aerilata]
MSPPDPYAVPGPEAGRHGPDPAPYAPPYERADVPGWARPAPHAAAPFPAPHAAVHTATRTVATPTHGPSPAPPTSAFPDPPWGGPVASGTGAGAPWAGPGGPWADGAWPPPALGGHGGALVRRVACTAAAVALAITAVVLASLGEGPVSVLVGLLGVVAGLLGLWPTPTRDRRGSGWAAAGLTASSLAAVVGGAVSLVAGTGLGAAVDDWASSTTDIDLPMVALRTGETGQVGDYSVVVDEIRLDADDDLSADPQNPPAEGRYVEAVVTVTYTGSSLGTVGDDLLVSYAGSTDEWLYDEWSCAAVTETPPYEVPRLSPGESATFVSCMDVPADVVDEPAVVVEDLTSVEPVGEMWGERPAS